MPQPLEYQVVEVHPFVDAVTVAYQIEHTPSGNRVRIAGARGDTTWISQRNAETEAWRLNHQRRAPHRASRA